MRPIAIAIIPLLLLFGCAGEKSIQAPNASNAIPQGGNFSLPQSSIAYVAEYVVDDNGAQVGKTIYRSGEDLRIDISPGAGSAFSLFFIGSSAYSCYNASAGASCYDISSTLSQDQVNELMPQFDMTDAQDAGNVNIGGTTGKCYNIPYDLYTQQKVCFTDTGILAYDSYNATRADTHVEYLTSLAYAAPDSDFALPASPQPMPQQG